MDINYFINNLDSETARRLKNLADTPKGQQLIKKLKNLDKSQLLQRVSKIDHDNIPKDELVRRIINDPELLNKLYNILDGK